MLITNQPQEIRALMLVSKDAGVANKGCCNVTGEGTRGQRWITYIACVTEKRMAVGGGVRDVTKSVLVTSRGSSGGVWRGLRAAEGPQPSAGLRGEHWGSIPWSMWTRLALWGKGIALGDPRGSPGSLSQHPRNAAASGSGPELRSLGVGEVPQRGRRP